MCTKMLNYWHQIYYTYEHQKQVLPIHVGIKVRSLAAFFQKTFSNAFSWMKIYKYRLRFHWSFFPKGQINNIPALVLIMGLRRSGEKPLSEPMMVSLLTHICATRPQWVNNVSLWNIVQCRRWFIISRFGKKNSLTDKTALWSQIHTKF